MRPQNISEIINQQNQNQDEIESAVIDALARGADPNLLTKDLSEKAPKGAQLLPIREAIRKNLPTVAIKIANHIGFNQSVRYNNGYGNYTIYHALASRKGFEELLKILAIKPNAQKTLNIPDKNAYLPLHDAAKYGFHHYLAKFIEIGVNDIDAKYPGYENKNPVNKTALSICLMAYFGLDSKAANRADFIQSIKLLLTKGASLNYIYLDKKPLWKVACDEISKDITQHEDLLNLLTDNEISGVPLQSLYEYAAHTLNNKGLSEKFQKVINASNIPAFTPALPDSNSSNQNKPSEPLYPDLHQFFPLPKPNSTNQNESPEIHYPDLHQFFPLPDPNSTNQNKSSEIPHLHQIPSNSK